MALQTSMTLDTGFELTYARPIQTTELWFPDGVRLAGDDETDAEGDPIVPGTAIYTPSDDQRRCVVVMGWWKDRAAWEARRPPGFQKQFIFDGAKGQFPFTGLDDEGSLVSKITLIYQALLTEPEFADATIVD